VTAGAPRGAGTGRGAYEIVYRVVRRIPPGRVATYGQVAALAGLGRHARMVGYALSACDDDDLPWHRVINVRGEISGRSDPFYEDLQRERLLAEGIRPDADGRISLDRYRWKTAG